MVAKNRKYRVSAVPSGLRKSYPLKGVKAGTVVTALEDAPSGSLDVVDVRTSSNRRKSVYSFQLHPPKHRG